MFAPLKMTRSNVIQPDFSISDRAFGYEREKDTFRISDAKESLFFSTMGDGGVYTSMEDYLRWITAIQQVRVLDPVLAKEAQSAQFPIDTRRNLSYGFGWFVAGSGDAKLVYHTGSNGGFRTIVLMKPSAAYAVVIFSNRSDIDLEDLVRIMNRIYAIDDKAFVKLDSLISQRGSPLLKSLLSNCTLTVGSPRPRTETPSTCLPKGFLFTMGGFDGVAANPHMDRSCSEGPEWLRMIVSTGSSGRL